MEKQSRRQFLKFLGRTGLALSAGSVIALLPSCSEEEQAAQQGAAALPGFTPKALQPSLKDDLLLAEGFEYDVLVSWGDALSEQEQFGFNNDFTAFIPLEKENEGILWVNHEYTHPLFVSGHQKGQEKSKEQVEKEMYSVGGSLLRVRKEKGKWKLVPNDAFNRRITAKTMIPFEWDEAIMGATEGMGTLANCSGGVTPWGTILTCEENYDSFYGERNYETGEREASHYGWEQYYDNPPEHYGWVVEVNPKTGAAKKLVALGRCAHECATVAELEDGRLVVYTGDDANDECLYKFVGSKPGSLKEGVLYVANMERQEWIALDWATQPKLQEQFKSQTEVLIRLREAAKLMGGTPLARPEDIEIDPLSGAVFVSLTNNKPKQNYFGEILKLEEKDKSSTQLQASTFLAGGEETGFACPDNLAFDRKGNLWFTSDISGSAIGKAPYTAFKNNGLYLVPTSGERAGEVIQIASAPKEAELTGPYFAPDGETLFLSVQHPGEGTKDLAQPSSTWPTGQQPKPSVVAIQGESMKKLLA